MKKKEQLLAIFLKNLDKFDIEEMTLVWREGETICSPFWNG